VLVLAPQSAADHIDSLADIGGRPGDDLYEARPLIGGAMQYDMPFEAEQGHSNPSGSLPHDRWTQRWHPNGARSSNHQPGKHVSVSQPHWVDRCELQQLVIERAHGLASGAGGGCGNGISIAFRHTDVIESRWTHDSGECVSPGQPL
jgi:hypothetical protein